MAKQKLTEQELKQRISDRKRKYYQEHKELLLKRVKDYKNSNPQKRKKCQRRYYENNKDKYYMWIKKSRSKYPEKRKAQQLSNRIELDGKICEVCKEREAEHRHHPDYSKPLEVMFLCHICHRQIHQVLNQGKQEALKQVLEKLEEWYKGWRKDKIQEFWRDDFEELKAQIEGL